MTLLLPAGQPQRNHIYHSDALAFTRSLPDEFIHCVITSPPYWKQRKYGVAGEWGDEPTLDAYIGNADQSRCSPGR